MITITLQGRPLSVNHLWKRGVNRATGAPVTYMPVESKHQKEAWQILAKAQFARERGMPFGKDVILSVSVRYFFENKMRRDIDNYLKATLDVLTGVVWLDDSQIWMLDVEKHIASDGDGPRTEIDIVEI